MDEYFSHMKTLEDELASIGKKLDAEELASYILAWLDLDFNPVVSALATRTELLSLGELFTQLTGFEQRLDLLQEGSSNSSANLAARGECGGEREHSWVAATVIVVVAAALDATDPTLSGLSPASSAGRKATPLSAATSVLMFHCRVLSPSLWHQKTPPRPTPLPTTSTSTGTLTLVRRTMALEILRSSP